MTGSFDEGSGAGVFSNAAAYRLYGNQKGISHCALPHAMMGRNFFGVEEWNALYGFTFTEKQLRKMPKFPWDRDYLEARCPFHEGRSIRETHFAFLGLDCIKREPLSIMKWHEIHPSPGRPRFNWYPPNVWYSDESFANIETCSLRWYLMPLQVIPDSCDKTLVQQKTLLPDGYEVPLAVEEITKLILCHRKNHIYPNPWLLARCRDVDSDGANVCVGECGVEGIVISEGHGNDSFYHIGIAACLRS